MSSINRCIANNSPPIIKNVIANLTLIFPKNPKINGISHDIIPSINDSHLTSFMFIILPPDQLCYLAFCF